MTQSWPLEVCKLVEVGSRVGGSSRERKTDEFPREPRRPRSTDAVSCVKGALEIGKQVSKGPLPLVADWPAVPVLHGGVLPAQPDSRRPTISPGTPSAQNIAGFIGPPQLASPSTRCPSDTLHASQA